GSGREVVVVVETDLADRARRRHRLELRADCIGSLLRLGRELVRLVWMNADGKADVRPEALDSVRLRRFLLVCCGENDERALDARFTRTSDDGLEIIGEDLVCQMAMRINQRRSVIGPAFRVRAARRTWRLSACPRRGSRRGPFRSTQSPSASPA